MKVSFLQMRRALNVALFVLLLSVAGTKNIFAQTQLATLQHGDDLRVFYGTNAFVAAHTAAVGGDIITLSGGTFTPTTITKGITLRGAGCEFDTVANTAPTIFSSGISLDVTDAANFLNVEGIQFNCGVTFSTLNNPTFTRCYMNSWRYNIYGNHSCRNAKFFNCFVKSFSSECCFSPMFINSVVKSFVSGGSGVSYNSIIHSASNLNDFSAFSSIIHYVGTNSHTNSTFINCIGIGSNPFGNSQTSGCHVYDSYEDVFETFTGIFEYGDSFILKDEVATSILGINGTQVGIYGGLMPYDIRPTYMVLKRCNVGSRTTIDGKLSVDIEVIAEEE